MAFFRIHAVRFLAIAATAIGLVVHAPARSMAQFNQPGNVLIADQFNNRVIEINRTGKILWHFGLGPDDTSPNSILGVTDAERVGQLTLITGKGIPADVNPDFPDGVVDNRVMLVGRLGKILWQYGKFGVTGSDVGELNTPVQSAWLPGGRVLITDQGNQRVIIVNLMHMVVWQYGTTGVAGNGPNQLNNPSSAELLSDGRILIADQGNDRAIEVTASKEIVAKFSAGETASGITFASRLTTGHTLLTDSSNNRIVEVDDHDHIVWQSATNLQAESNPNPKPTRGVRLRTGETLISDQFNQRVILINTSTKSIVAQFGQTNASGYDIGNASKALFAPYDAKVIGDFTGLTRPWDAAGLTLP
ncbi:MAG: hypothetical protein JSS49_00115 [Planctomycetes bacterium]|nr:hypothetical protein [Planctomycetota bacterium]